MTETDTKDPEAEVVKPMSKTERSELRRLLRLEKKQVTDELIAREKTIKDEIRERILTDIAKDAEAAEKEEAKLIAKAAKLKAEVDDFYARVENDGLSPGEINVQLWAQRKTDAPRVHTYESGRERLTITLPKPRWDSESRKLSFVPSDLGRRVQEEFANLTEERWNVQRVVEGEFLELEKELAIGALESGSAKQFLDRIPSAERLLPAPNGNGRKALNGGSK